MTEKSDKSGREHKSLLRRVGLELTGGSKPGNGVEGPRAIEAEQIMQLPLMIAAALTLPSLILLETKESGILLDISIILNWGTWLAFAIELLVMLILVPNRWKYLKHHPVEVIIVFLTPPILPVSLQMLRALRLLRLLRLLKLAEYSRTAFSTRGLLYASIMTLVISLTAGTLFRTFEAPNQDLTEWESIYWAITTMTTLGSQYESTTVGSEIVEILILLSGVTFISLLTGAIAHKFIQPPNQGESETAPDSAGASSRNP